MRLLQDFVLFLRTIEVTKRPDMATQISAIRGPVLTYTDEPYADIKQSKLGYEPDAIIMLVDGQISAVGPAATLKDQIPHGSAIEQSRNCRFIKISTHSE